MPNYSLGKVYKIEGNGKTYVGSTTRPLLSQRLAKHKNSYKDGKRWCSSYECVSDPNCRIELLENCPCETKDALLKCEGKWITELECVNKVVPEGYCGYKSNKERAEQIKLDYHKARGTIPRYRDPITRKLKFKDASGNLVDRLTPDTTEDEKDKKEEERIGLELVVEETPQTIQNPYDTYVSRMEYLIDKLEQRIDALNNAYETSETSSEYNPNFTGSLVGDFRHNEQTSKSEKSGELVNEPYPPKKSLPTERIVVPTFQFKEIELKAMRKFGDGSCITNTNALNALIRCKNWCEVFIKDEVRRKKNVSYIGRTIDMVKSLCSLISEGWRAEDEDYDAIGERMDEIMEHEFYV